MAGIGSGPNGDLPFKFLDKYTSAKYGCDVCQAVPGSALKAQCCGAIYCQLCVDLVQSSAAIAGENRAPGSLVTGNPTASTCTKCKGTNLRLILDTDLQQSIDELQVECPKAGCGWTGNYSAAESHLKEPHDNEEEIYDNECPATEPEQEDYEEMQLLPQQDPGEELYEDTSSPQQLEDIAEELYEDTGPPQQLEDIAEEFYEETGPPLQLEDTEDQVCDNEAPVNEPEIYEAPDPDAQDTGDQIYDNESPEGANPAKPNTHPEPPSDYRELATAEADQQQMVEPLPGKTQQQQETLAQMTAEEGSLTSYNSPRENPCLRCYNCSHDREFADLTASEKRLYVMGFLMGLLWILFVVAVAVVSIMSGVHKLRQGGASIAPNCGDYSIALLLVVVLAHLVIATFLLFWLCKGACKCCRGRGMNRATVSSLFLLIVIYVFIVAGFSASVLVFVNDSRSVAVAGNSTSDIGMSVSGSGSGMVDVSGGGGGGEDCEGDMASGSGSGNMSACDNRSTEVQPRREEHCIELMSEQFLLAVVFVGLLVIFIFAISCLLRYECSHNGFCYKREFYDPTVTVFDNETSFNY